MRKLTLARPSKHALARLKRRWAKIASPAARRHVTQAEQAWAARRFDIAVGRGRPSTERERTRIGVKHERRKMRARARHFNARARVRSDTPENGPEK